MMLDYCVAHVYHDASVVSLSGLLESTMLMMVLFRNIYRAALSSPIYE